MRLLLLVGLLFLPIHVEAQQPGRDVLLRQIFDRLVENYRVQAGLDDEQQIQFRSIFERQFRERRQAESRLREIIRDIESQLRPGVAADVDSLQTLLDAFATHESVRTETEARYRAEYAEFLSPVQQAQLVLTLERFQRQIDNLIRRRAGQNQRQN